MHGVTNVVFVVFAGIGALLAVIPLPKALASGNVGTSMLIIWTELACLVQFTNAIRWNGNIENWVPVWCDFCGYFLIVVDVALAACGVSINRRLYMIVTLDPRRENWFFNMVVDIVLCLVIPSVSIPLQYVVQQFRFFIFEDIGCLPGVGTVDLSFPLVWMLPLFVGTVSAGYACSTIREIFRRSRGLTGEAAISAAWSRRLMAIAAVSTMYGLIPTTTIIILLATAYPVPPWPGLTAIHSTNDVIAYVPALEWRSTSAKIASIELRRWTVVTLAYIIFTFLGLTADVKKMYWAPLRSVIGSRQASSGSKTVLERNVDGNLNDQKAPRSSRSSRSRRDYSLPSGMPRSERRGKSDCLTYRPRLDSDLEGFELVFPAPQPDPDATHSMYLSSKLHVERDDRPKSYMTGLTDRFDRVLPEV